MTSVSWEKHEQKTWRSIHSIHQLLAVDTFIRKRRRKKVHSIPNEARNLMLFVFLFLFVLFLLLISELIFHIFFYNNFAYKVACNSMVWNLTDRLVFYVFQKKSPTGKLLGNNNELHTTLTEFIGNVTIKLLFVVFTIAYFKLTWSFTKVVNREANKLTLQMDAQRRTFDKWRGKLGKKSIIMYCNMKNRISKI